MTDDSHGMGDRDHLRQELEARRRQVVDDLHRRLSRIRQVDGRAVASEPVEDDTSEIDVGLVDIMNTTVHRIDAALERLAEGVYGRCARCHRPISEARLRAMPFAVHCQACETTREHDAAVRRARSRPPTWDETRIMMMRTREES